MNLLLMESQSA